MGKKGSVQVSGFSGRTLSKLLQNRKSQVAPSGTAKGKKK